MSDLSYREFLDNDRSPFRTSSPSSGDSFDHPHSPIPTSGDNGRQTKLSKLLRLANMETSPRAYPKNLELKMDPKDKLKKRSSFQLNSNKELLESSDLIIDPVCERGLLAVLKGMKQKICKLGFFKTKVTNDTNLALVKSRLKMRRKSDVSKWSGGISHVEQITPFLVYDYVPAITLEDLSYKKEIISISPLMRKSIDKASLRLKNDRDTTPSVSGSPSLSPERREIDSMVRSPIVTLVMPDLTMKSCNIKDTAVVNLEDKTKTEIEQIQLHRFKEFLVSVGIGNKNTVKTAVVLTNQDNLRLCSANTNSVNSPYLNHLDSNGEQLKKSFEPLTLKPKTNVDRKMSLNERMKQKVHTFVEHTKSKLTAQPSLFIPPAPTLKPSPTLAPAPKPKHSRVHSQDSISILKHLEGKPEEKKEDKRPSKNIRIQTVAKKKLAEMLSPEKPVKTKPDVDKPASFNHPPKLVAMSFREPLHHDSEPNVKPLLLKNDKQMIHSHRASPSWGLSCSNVQQAYNKHNIKQVLLPIVKPKKVYKNPLAEELMPLNKRKFVIPKEYAPSKPVSKAVPKKITVP